MLLRHTVKMAHYLAHYSAAYKSQSLVQKRFIISEMAAPYAAIHCLSLRKVGLVLQHAGMPLKSHVLATLDFRAVARILLLIFHFAEGRRLSWLDHAII